MPIKKRVYKIGLTMRLDKTSGYVELRNAIAFDWQDFMEYALPEVSWVPIPNLGEKAVRLARAWGVEGLILTGGNDLGEYSERDKTEEALLSYSLSNSLPVFGVCRGLQMIQKYFGGELKKCPKDLHVRREHGVSFCIDRLGKHSLNKHITVNSYHNYGVKENILSPALGPVALADGGWVEALKAKKYPVLAVLWHPERDRPFREYDRIIIRSAFGL